MPASSFQRMFKAFFGLAMLGSCLLAGPAAALSTGDVAPLFLAASLTDDTTVDMARYRGKVLYLEFWASWCPSCWDAFPQMEVIRKDLRDEGLEGFEVIGVNISDNFASALSAVDQLHASFPLVRAYDDDVMHAYDVQAMPYGVLIDRKGVVHSMYLGLGRSDVHVLKGKIRRLLWKGL